MDAHTPIQNSKPITREFRNAYTDASELHPNLILGSLQLLFWLFFHPSAWRNHVARIDSRLRPDFFLAGLSRRLRRNPNLRELLIQGYLVLPLLGGLLVGVVLWASGQPVNDVAFAIALSSVYVLAGVVVGVWISLMLGIVFSVVAIVGAALAGGILGVDGAHAVAVAITVAIGVPGTLAADVAADIAMVNVAAAVSGGLVGGLAYSVAASSARQESTYSFTRQIGGVITGIMIGVVLFAITLGLGKGAGGVLGANVGLGLGVAVGMAIAVGWRTQRWLLGVSFGVTLGVVMAVAGILMIGLSLRMAYGVVYGALVGMLTGVSVSLMQGGISLLAYLLAERIAGPWAGAVAGALGVIGAWAVWWSIVIGSYFWIIVGLSLACAVLGLTFAWWRPVVLYPIMAAWGTLLYYSDQRREGNRPSLLRWNSAFWDEYQRLPLFGLDDHLALVMERNPAEGQAAIEYLVTSRQRWAAQAAQIELDARRLERCENVAAISEAHRGSAAGELAGPVSALLRSLSRISQDVDAALGQESAYNQRLALSAVEDRLDGLLRELTRSSERYALRFRPVARQWRQIVADHVHDLVDTVELRQEIDNPYVIGVPLTEQQEIFVGRTDIGARIEGLLLDRRRAPLLLYGQRRTGKTSLLNNLCRLLPSTIVPLFVDLQGPASQAKDSAGFLYNLARGMIDSAERGRDLVLPPLSHERLATDPSTRFDEWLDQVEDALEGDTALLALDEFETLDRAFARGRFEEEMVLGMLRHLIQHRPSFKVLLAGSHTLDEVQRWASYLINVQLVHIGYLKEDEARQLIERPVKDFALRYEPDASQRVLDLTRGHPALVQLLCGEIVALKNNQSPTVRRLARLTDVEEAVPEALSLGSFFFADIERNQVDAVGLAMLRFLAAQGEGAIVSQEALPRQLPDSADMTQALDLLTRRELIEAVGTGYRFQVEMVRRWFAPKPG